MKNDKDFSKIIAEEKLIGVLNFNSMIPVDDCVIERLDLRIKNNDNPQVKSYKRMCIKQLDWCQKNQEAIVIKANKLYTLVTQTPDKMRNLTRRCCDFKKLEAVLERRLAKVQSNEYEPKEKAVAASAEIPVRHPAFIRRRKNTGRSR